MSNYEKALNMQNNDIDFEVVHVASGQVGYANIYQSRVFIFIGDDGSSDKYISIDEFNREYKVNEIVTF